MKRRPNGCCKWSALRYPNLRPADSAAVWQAQDEFPDHLIVNGAGGAFLHPTHVFAEASWYAKHDSAAESIASMHQCKVRVSPELTHRLLCIQPACQALHAGSGAMLSAGDMFGCP